MQNTVAKSISLQLSRKEIEEIYGTRHIGRDQARGLVGLMDFFCFSEVSFNLFAPCLVKKKGMWWSSDSASCKYDFNMWTDSESFCYMLTSRRLVAYVLYHILVMLEEFSKKR